MFLKVAGLPLGGAGMLHGARILDLGFIRGYSGGGGLLVWLQRQISRWGF